MPCRTRPALEFSRCFGKANDACAIFRVISKNDFDPAAFAAQRRKLEDAARQQEAQRLIGAEIARRRPQEKIIVNEDALKRYIQG